MNNDIEFCENGGIIYAQLQSRHINRKSYKCYVKYISNKNDHDGIESWYCSCMGGFRMLPDTEKEYNSSD